jgi:hypothetical protein
MGICLLVPWTPLIFLSWLFLCVKKTKNILDWILWRMRKPMKAQGQIGLVVCVQESCSRGPRSESQQIQYFSSHIGKTFSWVTFNKGMFETYSNLVKIVRMRQWKRREREVKLRAQRYQLQTFWRYLRDPIISWIKIINYRILHKCIWSLCYKKVNKNVRKYW